MDTEQIKLIYSLGGGRKDVLLKVLLPGSLPLIISNMKVNIGLCLVGVIIGEFLSAKAGLGYLITYGVTDLCHDHGGDLHCDTLYCVRDAVSNHCVCGAED